MKKKSSQEAELRAAYQNLSIAYDQLEDEITQRWQFQHERATAQMDKDKHTIDRLKVKLEMITQDVAKQTVIAAGLNAELVKIRKSKSWRITAPLRRLSGKLR